MRFTATTRTAAYAAELRDHLRAAGLEPKDFEVTPDADKFRVSFLLPTVPGHPHFANHREVGSFVASCARCTTDISFARSITSRLEPEDAPPSRSSTTT